MEYEFPRVYGQGFIEGCIYMKLGFPRVSGQGVWYFAPVIMGQSRSKSDQL